MTPAHGRRSLADKGFDMATHRFAIGQAVYFSPDRGQEQVKETRFKIVRLLPLAGSALQYRLKSETDGRERVAREDQLSKV